MTMTDNRSRAVLARDAALARVSRTRRWVIAGAAALTAGIAGLVSAVAPGRSLASKSAVRTEASTGSSSAIPPLPPVAGPSSLGLGGDAVPLQSAPPPAPSTAPASSPQPAPAPVSGGS